MVEIGLSEAKTPPKRPSGAPKTSQRRPQNPPKAIFGSKRRANQAQESSKMNLEALFGRSRGPSELPRALQELPKGARESPKTIAKPSSRLFFSTRLPSPAKQVIIHFPAFLCMIGSWGCLITRKNAGIVAFAVL